MTGSILTHESVKELLNYNPGTGIFTWKVGRRGKAKAGLEAGCYVKDGYLQIKFSGKALLAHRLAWFIVHGSWPDGEIDHINQAKDDNRLENLRVVTRSVNNCNKPKYKNNTSGVMGVTWCNSHSRWIARMNTKCKRITLGSFEDFFLAVCARKSAEIKYGFHANHGGK